MEKRGNEEGEGERIGGEMVYAEVEKAEIGWDIVGTERMGEGMTPEREGFRGRERLGLKEGQKGVGGCWKS